MRPQQIPANAETADDVESGRDQFEQTENLESQPPIELAKALEVDTPQSSSSPQSMSSKDRYFILKSLTKEDLAWSVANKVWATQPHNESILNEAFKVRFSMFKWLTFQNAQNVYLIFSVNKSGEFFGYARMASEINNAADNEKIEVGDQSDTHDISKSPVPLLAGPKTTVTPRTNSAPRGKIFEDDVRGTVFWEVADSSEDEDTESPGDQGSKGEKKWGNPFKVEWIKWYATSSLKLMARDASLQFQRTRTLRNPWNGNREIKISRDGTEIEPTVGARLLKEFENESHGLDYSEASDITRRMSYPPTARPGIASPPVMYQTSPQIPPQVWPQAQGWQYVPFTAASSPPQGAMYNYPQAAQAPQQFGGSPQSYPYSQLPR